MNPQVTQWALRWGVPYDALRELNLIFGLMVEIHQSYPPNASESFIQSRVRLEASVKGLKLWRNNVGSLPDERGVPIRYGLGNDSERLNKIIKSGDLIGWRPLVVTPAHVGSKIAQFISRECKKPNWQYTGTDRERAQLRWIEAIIADGGDASFCVGEGSL